ncbi:hypothetical protein GCM10009504_29120 [Pseudomonas laurentiana]|nr:hypothetical protein GCM10009504_29120 [Pseudomonas laurentiana]
MAKRYELPDAAWELVADLFIEARRGGRPRADDRLMLNGVLWVLCSGAAWRDMPKRFGPWSTIYQRFRDWRKRGIFDQFLKRLHIRLNEHGLIDLNTWVIDSITVRGRRTSSSAEKTGLKSLKIERSTATAENQTLYEILRNSFKPNEYLNPAESVGIKDESARWQGEKIALTQPENWLQSSLSKPDPAALSLSNLTCHTRNASERP